MAKRKRAAAEAMPANAPAITPAAGEAAASAANGGPMGGLRPLSDAID